MKFDESDFCIHLYVRAGSAEQASEMAAALAKAFPREISHEHVVSSNVDWAEQYVTSSEGKWRERERALDAARDDTHIHVYTWLKDGSAETCRECGVVKP
jgi:hypothetical protein